jgi:hypothetical protein
MQTEPKTTRMLGIALLLQFVTSLSSGVFIKSAWFVPEDMSATMLKIATNPGLVRANILVDMLTALGVTFLGAMLYLTLSKQNEKIALTALGFYVLEASLLAVSRMETFALLRFSQAYVAAGQPADVLLLGQVAYEAMDFTGNTLHMLAFCLGAILFYSLLDQARIVPRWLSLWGLVTVFPMLVGTVSQMFGYTIPFLFYLPYVPFELVLGVWILVKGIPELRTVQSLNVMTPVAPS